jgi:hypothetical protein
LEKGSRLGKSLNFPEPCAGQRVVLLARGRREGKGREGDREGEEEEETE